MRRCWFVVEKVGLANDLGVEGARGGEKVASTSEGES